MKCINCFLVVIFLSCNFSTGNGQDLTGIIPDAGELSPLVISARPQVYGRDNLWEYINGAAPNYLHFGFQQVITFVVMNTDSAEAVVDIFNMGDSLNAFGMFAQEKSPKGKPVNLGSGAAIYSNSLYFWQDCYYIKLIAYFSTPGIPGFLTRLGGIISAKLPARGSLPHLFTLFPLQERRPGSERYYAQDVLGQPFLRNGYSAEYADGNDKYTIFIIPCANEQDAREKFTKFQSSKILPPKAPEMLNNAGDDALIYKDSYYGKGHFILKKFYIAGILGNMQDSTMGNILEMLQLPVQ